MPQAIPFAAAYAASNLAASAGAAVAAQATIAATTATIAATLQTTALIVGASYVVSRLTRPSIPKPQDGKVEFSQEVPIRVYHYGRLSTSGPIALFETDEARSLFRIVCISSREIGGIQEYWLDDTKASLDVDGFVTNAFFTSEALANLRSHLGPDSQTADADLITSLSGVAAGNLWTTAHRLRGIAYVICEYNQGGNPDDFQFAYPNGVPNLRCVIDGAKLYDPRLDSTNGGSGSHRTNDPTSWTYSDNQRLVALDYLTWRDGWAKSFDRIDWATWVPQIEMAEDQIPLKAGGTEGRYRIALPVSMDAPKSRILHQILEAGDQQLFPTADGLIGSRGGIWEDPTVSLDAFELPESEFSPGIPLMDRVNEFQLSAMLPTHNYAEVDLEPWSKQDDPEWIAGVVRRQPLQLTQVPSNAQAQRLAKIKMAKLRPSWRGTVRTRLDGLKVLGESVVSLTSDELGIDNETFFVDGKVSILADKTGVTFPVISASEASYDWDAATEEQDAPPVPRDAVLVPNQLQVNSSNDVLKIAAGFAGSDTLRVGA